jgi:hypothetical protein
VTARTDSLADQAADFSTRLTELLNGTVTTGARITSALIPSKDRRVSAVVAPGAAKAAPSLPKRPEVPLSTARTSRVRARAPLWLRVSFRLVLDPEREWAAVHNSSFGLLVKGEPPRPALRIEFDREKKAPRAAAHVHVHGHSQDLGFAYGACGKTPRPLEKLHIPVGGRRFRPCLEDFIEFLGAEGLITGLHPGWQDVLDCSRREFYERQLRAAIRRDQQIAADALEQLGWTVAPPP